MLAELAADGKHGWREEGIFPMPEGAPAMDSRGYLFRDGIVENDVIGVWRVVVLGVALAGGG